MSWKQRLDLTLMNYEGPLYPEKLEALRRVLAAKGGEGGQLVRALIRLPDCRFVREDADRDNWYGRAYFGPEERMVLRCPWWQDARLPDGTMNDGVLAEHAPAFYHQLPKKTSYSLATSFLERLLAEIAAEQS